MTTTRAFTSSETQRFWEGNAARYSAEEHGEPIVFLARSCIGRRVLDAGAGEGSLLRAVRAKYPGSEAIGVDIAPKSDDVEMGDLMQLRFEDGHFDTVFCSEVIEHVSPEDTNRILTELARVLEPNGHLVLTTPYDENLADNLVACPTCDQTFHRWGHQQTFVEADFERLAREHGLEPRAVFPVKFSRVRRFRALGPRFFQTQMHRRKIQRSGGNRTLIMLARKT